MLAQFLIQATLRLCIVDPNGYKDLRKLVSDEQEEELRPAVSHPVSINVISRQLEAAFYKTRRENVKDMKMNHGLIVFSINRCQADTAVLAFCV